MAINDEIWRRVNRSKAVRQAENYLSFSAFSRTGLIEQLEFEEFSTKPRSTDELSAGGGGLIGMG